MASGSAGRWMRWKMRNKNPLTAPHPRIPVWARRLKTQRPADSENPPESVHPPTQSSPKTVGRPTSATRGDAQTRRGRQQAERCHRMGISGRTCGDAGLQKVSFLLWRVEARSDTALAASHNVGLPPPAGSIRLFLSPPSITIKLDREAGPPVRLSFHLVPKLQ